MDILAAYQEVGSYRGAAAICGTTHKTVRRVVEAHEASCAGQARPARTGRGHNYESMRDLVIERVRKSQGRVSAKRLLPAARAAGYAGSARNFRRLVAEVKAAWRAGHPRGRRNLRVLPRSPPVAKLAVSGKPLADPQATGRDDRGGDAAAG